MSKKAVKFTGIGAGGNGDVSTAKSRSDHDGNHDHAHSDQLSPRLVSDMSVVD